MDATNPPSRTDRNCRIRSLATGSARTRIPMTPAPFVRLFRALSYTFSLTSSVRARLLDRQAEHQLGLGILEVLERDRADVEAAGDGLHLRHQLLCCQRAFTRGQLDVLGIGLVAFLLPAFTLEGLLGLLGAVALELVEGRSLRHGYRA